MTHHSNLCVLHSRTLVEPTISISPLLRPVVIMAVAHEPTLHVASQETCRTLATWVGSAMATPESRRRSTPPQALLRAPLGPDLERHPQRPPGRAGRVAFGQRDGQVEQIPGICLSCSAARTIVRGLRARPACLISHSCDATPRCLPGSYLWQHTTQIQTAVDG